MIVCTGGIQIYLYCRWFQASRMSSAESCLYSCQTGVVPSRRLQHRMNQYYWNGQLVWTQALGLYTGMDN